MKRKDTSWKRVGKWYDSLVSKEGHYYHKEVILPALESWITLKKGDALLDLACGQGVLSRHVSKGVTYFGLDAAKPLIAKAKTYTKNDDHHFLVRDVTKPLRLEKKDFNLVTLILAFQNIETPQKVLTNAYQHLKKGGRLILVLNHPYFRIPRQTSWGVDEKKKVQYRRIDRYMTPMEIPIQMQPSQKQKSTSTLSFHYPLEAITICLFEAGFVLTKLEEWCSNKVSTGKKAKMENRAREEFPLFMGIECTKI